MKWMDLCWLTVPSRSYIKDKFWESKEPYSLFEIRTQELKSTNKVIIDKC